jgi:hypothetical protein
VVFLPFLETTLPSPAEQDSQAAAWSLWLRHGPLKPSQRHAPSTPTLKAAQPVSESPAAPPTHKHSAPPPSHSAQPQQVYRLLAKLVFVKPLRRGRLGRVRRSPCFLHGGLWAFDSWDLERGEVISIVCVGSHPGGRLKGAEADGHDPNRGGLRDTSSESFHRVRAQRGLKAVCFKGEGLSGGASPGSCETPKTAPGGEALACHFSEQFSTSLRRIGQRCPSLGWAEGTQATSSQSEGGVSAHSAWWRGRG